VPVVPPSKAGAGGAVPRSSSPTKGAGVGAGGSSRAGAVPSPAPAAPSTPKGGRAAGGGVPSTPKGGQGAGSGVPSTPKGGAAGAGAGAGAVGGRGVPGAPPAAATPPKKKAKSPKKPKAARDPEKWLLVENDAPMQLAVEVYRNEGCPATPQNGALAEYVVVTHGTSGQMCARWIPDLLSGSQHYVRVQVKNKVGWSKPSDVIAICGTRGSYTVVVVVVVGDLGRGLRLCSCGSEC
jgi:hypothetical protein